MTFYIVRRLTLLLPTIFLASVIIFVLMRSIPGDPASLQIGDESSRAQVDAPINIDHYVEIIDQLEEDVLGPEVAVNADHPPAEA